MSSETLDTRIGHTHKVILKGTPEKKKKNCYQSVQKRCGEGKRKTLAITKRYALKRKLKNEKFKSFVIIIVIHVKNLFHWDKKG